jgi:hypothetical protein
MCSTRSIRASKIVENKRRKKMIAWRPSSRNVCKLRRKKKRKFKSIVPRK